MAQPRQKTGRKTGDRDYFDMEQEDYLEVIYRLEQQEGVARISEVAKALDVRKPSVSQMAERLKKKGYISYEPYKDMRLTARGRAIAVRISECRQVLTDFFTTLGIPKKVQTHDIHGMEHYLSPITLKKLQLLTKKSLRPKRNTSK